MKYSRLVAYSVVTVICIVAVTVWPYPTTIVDDFSRWMFVLNTGFHIVAAILLILGVVNYQAILYSEPQCTIELYLKTVKVEHPELAPQIDAWLSGLVEGKVKVIYEGDSDFVVKVTCKRMCDGKMGEYNYKLIFNKQSHRCEAIAYKGDTED